MTTLPEKTRGIDPAMLSEGDYFLSLLDQGLRLGLVTNRNTERILSGCMDLLREVTERYTRGGSSSVRVETAQGLLDGVCFTIGVALKAMDSPAAALDALHWQEIVGCIAGDDTIFCAVRSVDDTMIVMEKLKKAIRG